MKNTTAKPIGIYTDLDSLYDTRAIMISAITDKGKYGINMQPIDYLTRIRDNFGTLSSSIFRSYYKERNNKTLYSAPETYINTIIMDYVTDLMVNFKEETPIKIYVNTYPYSLTVDELQTMTQVMYKLLPKTEIIMLYKDPYDIEPSWVKKNIKMMIFYDALSWIRYITDYSPRGFTDLLDVTIIAPFILEGNIPSKEVNGDLIDMLTSCFNVICKFVFIEAGMFSIRHQPDIEKESE